VKAIEILMDEHRRIEQVLGSLETFAFEVAAGRAAERPLLADYASFFREFADAAHHAKEEDLLFARLLERGFSRENGPVAVMLYEHKAGRAHVSALREVGRASGPIGAVETQLVLEHASAFVPLLRTHILKEDRILYPMAERFLSPAEFEAMAGAFLERDERLRQDGSAERLQALATRLVECFRPDPVRMASASQMAACAG